MKKFLLMLIMVLGFSLAACGQKFDGTYSTGDRQTYFTFTSDGKFVTNSMLLLVGGVNPEGRYKIDGKNIRMLIVDKNDKEEEMLWNLSDTGSINAGIFGVLTKK